jgi:protease II
LAKRKDGIYNTIKEFDESLYLMTNENAVNNRIMVYENENWKEVVPHMKNRLINNFIVTENFVILSTFNNSFSEIIYKEKGDKKWETVEFPFKINDVEIYKSTNENTVMIDYSSPQEPFVRYSFDLEKEYLHKVYTSKIKRNF